ncbi:MAG: glycerophosphodiester phosphodiesterase [Candidatus Hodarchaeota archaeon]
MNRIIMGHRGASGDEPENTLRAFERAWQLGADFVELDLQETVDGHLVCMHDLDVSRTTNGSGLVSDLSLQEIRSLDAGMGEHVPLLDEVLNLAKGKFGVNIELKSFDIEEKVIEMVRKKDMVDSVLISSYYHIMLSITKDIDCSFKTAIIFEGGIDNVVDYTLQLNADAINPPHQEIDSRTIWDAHNKGLKVYPWTVNDPGSILELFQMGADGVITDYPDRAVQVRDSFRG